MRRHQPSGTGPRSVSWIKPSLCFSAAFHTPGSKLQTVNDRPGLAAGNPELHEDTTVPFQPGLSRPRRGTGTVGPRLLCPQPVVRCCQRLVRLVMEGMPPPSPPRESGRRGTGRCPCIDQSLSLELGVAKTEGAAGAAGRAGPSSSSSSFSSTSSLVTVGSLHPSSCTSFLSPSSGSRLGPDQAARGPFPLQCSHSGVDHF